MAALVVHVCTLCGFACACLWMNFKHMHLTARFQHIHTFDKFTLAIISRMLQKRWKFICYLYFCVQWNSPKQLHAHCVMWNVLLSSSAVTTDSGFLSTIFYLPFTNLLQSSWYLVWALSFLPHQSTCMACSACTHPQFQCSGHRLFHQDQFSGLKCQNPLA